MSLQTGKTIAVYVIGLIVAMFVVDIAGKWGRIAAMKQILHRGEFPSQIGKKGKVILEFTQSPRPAGVGGNVTILSGPKTPGSHDH